jgi:hypothetical protein
MDLPGPLEALLIPSFGRPAYRLEGHWTSRSLATPVFSTLLKEDAGEVAGGSREACHITARERIIIYRNHHDRLRAGGREGGLEADLRPAGKENVHVTPGEFLVAAFVSLDVWDLHIFENEVLAFLVSQLGHALQEGDVNRRRPRLDADQADAQELLRARRERPRGRATNFRSTL